MIFLLSLLVGSCTREEHQPKDSYLQNVQSFLKEVMQAGDFEALDFSRPVGTKVDSAGLHLLRIPFTGKALRQDFVLVQTNKEGHVQRGKIIHLEGARTLYGEGTVKEWRFEGRITISTLDRKSVLHSPITNGFIQAFHGDRSSQRSASLMPSGETLPEVVVVGYINYDYGVSYSDWCYLQGLLYDPYNGGSRDYSSAYYGSLDGGSYGGGGYTGGSGSSGGSYVYFDGGIMLDPPILIDYENQDGLNPIDIQQYINCFNNIPDAGATCSIEILADIPVDANPNLLFDFNNGSPGHTFIQIKKSNGSQSAMQNIGFYPKSGWKTILTNAPIAGKFVDNSEHEFNASFSMSLSPEQLRSTLTEILYLSNFIQYDIDNYNCTDFALNVFNKTRTNKLLIDLYDIPGNYPSSGTRTPQGLYNRLKLMKDTNHPEASNITLSNFKCWVALSTGPCN